MLDLLAAAQTMLWLHFVVFLRVAPIIALFPGFGEQAVPTRIKLGLAFALTVIVAPAIAPDIGVQAARPLPLARLVLSETGVGLLLGLGLRLFMLALQTAGSIAAQSTSLAQILGNASITPLPAMGHILVTGAIARCTLGEMVQAMADVFGRYSGGPGST